MVRLSQNLKYKRTGDVAHGEGPAFNTQDCKRNKSAFKSITKLGMQLSGKSPA